MDACETVEAFVENDLAFHQTIAFASRNPVLASLLESFSSRTSRARVWRGITQAGAIEQTKTDHRAIYENDVRGPMQALLATLDHLIGDRSIVSH